MFVPGVVEDTLTVSAAVLATKNTEPPCHSAAAFTFFAASVKLGHGDGQINIVNIVDDFRIAQPLIFLLHTLQTNFLVEEPADIIDEILR